MQENRDNNTRVCLVGMSPDTANLGVSALCASVLSGLAGSSSPFQMTLWDYGVGTRHLSWKIGGITVEATRCGAYHSRRFYRSEALWNIRICARLGGLWNGGARSVRTADAFLDISGGDSFTDLYGPLRFRSVVLPKHMAIERRKPLILLPQTYGPFQDPATRKIAQDIVRSSTMAWARDARSFEALKSLLGSAFEPERHRVGVDVAFRLPATRPGEAVIADRIDWFEGGQTPLVGLNISGLLCNHPATAAERYGLKTDYREAIVSFLRRLLRDTDARVLLIPHVVTSPGHYESDIQACEAIASEVSEKACGRLAVAPVVRDPCEVKWIIAQCDWFCGTRMHSTIAALSSGVPTAAISYSPKTLGVFESCAQGAHVADPTALDTQAVVEQLWWSWNNRDLARESLAAVLSKVIDQAVEQMDLIAATCHSISSARTMQVG